MSKFMKSRRNRRRGFTLMELMVVIVIIGVLATAGFMTFQWAIGSSKYAKGMAQISSIKDLVYQYKNMRGEFPSSLEELEEQFDENIPDDPWGRPYNYESADGSFSLWSDGEIEGQEGDDIYYDFEEQTVVDETQEGGEGDA